MKKNAVMMNAEVVVKVPFQGTADQLRGTITAIDSNVITVTETLSEEDKAAGKKPREQKIPVGSAEALAFVKNPNIPDAKVEDGILVVNGDTIRTGFTVASVLVTLKNRVYVTAKVEDTDRVDVYSYNVAKDEFYKVTRFPLALDEKKTEIGSSVIFSYLNKRQEEEEVTKTDGTTEKVPYEVLEGTGYLMISTETTLADIVPTELGNSPITDARTVGKDAALFVTTSTVKVAGSVISDCYDDYDDYDEDDYDDDDDDDDCDCGCACSTNSGKIIPVDEGCVIVRVYRAQGRHLSKIAEVELDGTYVSAVVAGRTTVIKTDKNIFVIAGNRNFEVTDKVALKALDGFNYVVKTENKNGVFKAWFSDKEGKLKVYSVTPAEDARGPIIDVQ